jgi:purine-binding chemotaxis protein CheW
MIAKAEQLVARGNGKNDAGAEQEYVTFRVGAQWLGMPVLAVQEVFTGHSIARVPLAPKEVQGFLNVRGQIVTAVDLRTRLNLPQRAAGEPFMNVVVRDQGELFSLLVDEVGDVQAVTAGQLEPPSSTLDGHWREVCESVVRRDKGLLVVVNVRELLNVAAAAA